MKELLFVTGNKDKFLDAVENLKKYGYRAVQNKIDIKELQESDGEAIARHKAEQAYLQLKQPLIVNDTIWLIPALNNYPGPYMKFANECFEPEDWLRLMEGIKDRRAIMREILVYKDGTYEKTFSNDIVGEFLYGSTGNDGVSSDKVISFTGDKTSIATARDKGNVSTGSMQGKTSYDLLGEWLQSIESPSIRNIA